MSEPPPRESVLVAPLVTWAALIALLLVNVAAAFTPLGPVKTAANLGLGGVMALVNALFFMRLTRASNLVRLTALAGLVWVSFLFVLAGADVLSRP